MQYRELLTTGRIRESDIEAVLIDHLGDRADDLLGFLGTRFGLYRAILNHSLHDGPSVDLKWVIGDTNALNRFRSDAADETKKQFINETRQWVMRDLRKLKRDKSDSHEQEPSAKIPAELLKGYDQIFDLFGAGQIEKWSDDQWESFVLHLLWKTCEFGASQMNGVAIASAGAEMPETTRHRDCLLELTCDDPDELVDAILIPFCAAFLDQGFSNWQLANREQGMFSAFVELYGTGTLFVEPWRRGLAEELRSHVTNWITPVESIRRSLVELGVTPEELDSFVSSSLLALRGYAGMLWQLESRGDRVSRAMPEGTLVEFLAIRLILDRFAAKWVAKSGTSFRGSLAGLRPWASRELARQSPHHATQKRRNAFRIFELAQLLGWRPKSLAQHRPAEWRRLISEVNQFSGTERRQIFHLAYERKYRIETLDAIRIHTRRNRQLKQPRTPIKRDFQILCCIDEREESFRRHLEEIFPNCQTFGAAGFFAIPMYYRGAADAHFTPLCPVVIKPDHYVREEVVYSLKKHESQRKRARRTIGTVTHRVHIGSRTFTGGWLGTALLGSLATFPLVARILFPRLTAQFRGLLGDFVKPPEVTRLQLERNPEFPPGSSPDQLGFTVAEMARTVERLLRDIGLTSGFCPVLFCLRPWLGESQQSS